MYSDFSPLFSEDAEVPETAQSQPCVQNISSSEEKEQPASLNCTSSTEAEMVPSNSTASEADETITLGTR